jgi:hypothetical protein
VKSHIGYVKNVIKKTKNMNKHSFKDYFEDLLHDYIHELDPKQLPDSIDIYIEIDKDTSTVEGSIMFRTLKRDHELKLKKYKYETFKKTQLKVKKF